MEAYFIVSLTRLLFWQSPRSAQLKRYDYLISRRRSAILRSDGERPRGEKQPRPCQAR